jgi:hypothetical protein
MKAGELIAELKRRNRDTLYHACTLTTFKSYCQLGGYHSRAHLGAARLPLTPQVSDAVDARLGIDEHLFLNVFDQHGDVHRGRSVTGINKYGAILMVFDVDSIANYVGEFKGYKKEISAFDYSPAAHDVSTIEDFRQNTFQDIGSQSVNPAPARRPGTPGPNMCVHCVEEFGGISFRESLKEVVVDCFGVQFQALQERVMDEVKALTKAASSETIVTQRSCISGCDCEHGYGVAMTEREVTSFLYETNAVVYDKTLRRPR